MFKPLSTTEVLPSFFFSKEQHLKKIHSLENSLNSTRQDIKEVSQEHFKALWLAGNSTNAELRRVWTAVNSTQIDLLGQLKKVKDNLTDQVYYTNTSPRFKHDIYTLATDNIFSQLRSL